MPDARIELDYRTPLELLVAVILSAQCTDKRVNLVTPALFQRYPGRARATPARSRRAGDVHPDVRPVPRQGEEPRRGGRRRWSSEHGGEVPARAGRAGAAAGRGPQDRRRGVHPPGRRRGLPGGHPREAAGAPAGLHPPARTRTRWSRTCRRCCRRSGGPGPPAAGVARAADVLRAVARVRALRGGGPVPEERRAREPRRYG